MTDHHEFDPGCCGKKADAGSRAKRPWFLEPLFIVCGALAALLALAAVWPPLEPFYQAFMSYAARLAPALAAGLLIGGLIERIIPQEYVSIALARPGTGSIVRSVFLGFIMSACSHGMLAIAVQLYRKGAPVPVVVSFLLASPWANLPITILLFSLFGAKALFIVLAALFVSFVTGLIFQALETRGLVEHNPNTLSVKPYSIGADFKRRASGYLWSASRLASDGRLVLRASAGLAAMTLPWVLVGVGLSSLLGAFVPQDLFRRLMGPSVGGLFATLGFATVAEVCSEGMSPLAFEIYRQTQAFGNAFVFLMAGVVTDYTEIALLWSNVGRRTALWLPAVAVPQVVALGYLANHIF